MSATTSTSTSTSGAAAQDIRVRLGARPVINLTGTLTALGGISARPEAIAAAAEMLGHGVDIVELQACASRIISECTGAEAGFVAGCTSAGLCMAVAGAMTGDDLARIERLPDTEGLRDEVLVQCGHLVDYGHPIVQDVRLTGARVVSVGAVNAARAYQLESAIGPRTAAALYVVSHHCVQHGQIGFADFTRVCHAGGIPVIVDLAAEYALETYLRAGADLTVHSAQKFLGGATAGIVCGRKSLVRAAYLQSFGIGRPMKVGKEGIAAALTALRCFVCEDRAAVREADRERLCHWQQRLAGYAGVSAEIDPDPTGNPFDRLRLRIDAGRAGLSAVDLVHRLETGTPPIMVRAHQLELGELVMDPRSLGEGELEIVADRLCAILDTAAAGGGAGAAGAGDIHAWRVARTQRLQAWPDVPVASAPDGDAAAGAGA